MMRRAIPTPLHRITPTHPTLLAASTSLSLLQLILQRMILRALRTVIVADPLAEDSFLITHVRAPAVDRVTRDRAIAAEFDAVVVDVGIALAVVVGVGVLAHLAEQRYVVQAAIYFLNALLISLFCARGSGVVSTWPAEDEGMIEIVVYPRHGTNATSHSTPGPEDLCSCEMLQKNPKGSLCQSLVLSARRMPLSPGSGSSRYEAPLCLTSAHRLPQPPSRALAAQRLVVAGASAICEAVLPYSTHWYAWAVWTAGTFPNASRLL